MVSICFMIFPVFIYIINIVLGHQFCLIRRLLTRPSMQDSQVDTFYSRRIIEVVSVAESEPGNTLYSIIEYLAAMKPHSVLMTKISFTVRNNKKNNNDFLKDKYMRINIAIEELKPVKLLLLDSQGKLVSKLKRRV